MTNPEQVLTRSLMWSTAGAACAVPILVLPQPDDPLLTMTVHLSLLVLFGIALVFHLAPLVEEPWFDGLGLGTGGRTALTWMVAGAQAILACGLATIATAAAFRYAPSVQFLVLLAVLGVVASITIAALGARRRFGPTVAGWTAVAIGAVGVWPIWRYGATVGFTPDGGWLVDGGEVLRVIVPVDLIRWAVALTLFTMGVRRASAD